MGVELEVIGSMNGDSLDDQITDEIDFMEVLAREANQVMDSDRTPVVLEWEKNDMDDYSMWTLVDDASVEAGEGERQCK